METMSYLFKLIYTHYNNCCEPKYLNLLKNYNCLSRKLSVFTKNIHMIFLVLSVPL